MRDPRIFSLLKQLATKDIDEKNTGIQFIVIVSNKMEIPSELEIYINLISIPLPNEAELKCIIKDQIDRINTTRKRTGIEKLKTYDEDISRFALLLKGMTEHEVGIILKTAYFRPGLCQLPNGVKKTQVTCILRKEDQRGRERYHIGREEQESEKDRYDRTDNSY